MVLPKRTDGETEINLNLYLVKHSCLLLTCTAVQLFCLVLQNNLIPRTHHYSVYFLWKFLRIFICGYPASNTVINSSTSSCASNILLTPLSSQPATIYGTCIIILEPSFGTKKFIMIGNTDIFWLGTKDTGNTINIARINPNTSLS